MPDRRPPGRPRGSVAINPTLPRSKSLNDRLQHMDVGEYVYLESSAERCLRLAQHATAMRDKPASMKHMQFRTRTMTAVGKIGETVVLVRVERIK